MDERTPTAEEIELVKQFYKNHVRRKNIWNSINTSL